MKTIISSIYREVCLIIASFMMCGLTYGSVFTATSSGNYSSGTTWSGGVAPSFVLTTGHVNIASGVMVNLDNNLTLAGNAAELDVGGTLYTLDNSSLIVNLGTLSGAGTINLESISFNSGLVFTFNGMITSNILNSAADYTSSAEMLVNQTLNLVSGAMTVGSGGSLNIGNNANIHVSGGMLMLVSGGALGLSNMYNVQYTGNSATTGVELSGSGLQNVEIALNHGSTLTLASDLTVGGTLTLTNGILDLAGKNLSIDGDIGTLGLGMISSTSASDITVATPYPPVGPLMFLPGYNTVGNFNVNIGGGGYVSTATDMMIDGALTFTSGSLNVGSHGLLMGASGYISGYGITSYVITDYGGYLQRHLSAGCSCSEFFPVGTIAHYAPVNIHLNSGAANTNYMVGVRSSVLSNATSETDLSATLPLVDATWTINSGSPANMNMNLQLIWPTTLEVNSFDHSAAYIAHYKTESWDSSPLMMANSESGGMYSLQRMSIITTGQFAVFGQASSSAITELAMTPPLRCSRTR